MDRLIEDYEKALTEEFVQRDRMEKFQKALKEIEAETWFDVMAEDPKLPQWKAQHVVLMALSHSPPYGKISSKFNEAEYNYRMAKVYLAVAVERLKLTRARLYGGRHDLLDMPEVDQDSDEDLD